MNSEPGLLPIIRQFIRQRGTLNIATYMGMCLSHPQYGYYMSREPFGEKGDFTTAPEISQLFGEMVALWVMTMWQQLGSPPEVQLVEFGPGRGVLMRDLWRGLGAMPELREILSVHMVEFSPRLQKIQQETLGDLPVTWHEVFDTVPKKKSIMVANEFFDALPIEQAVFHNGHWHQRVVVLEDKLPSSDLPREGGDPLSRPATENRLSAPWAPAFAGDTGEGLTFGVGARLQGIFVQEPQDGDIFEYAPMTAGIMEQICHFLKEQGGAFLTADYGDDLALDERLGETLQAIYERRSASILEHPGEADLTAHVAFASLKRIANENKLLASIQTQREFLTQFGIRLRAEKLLAKATKEQAAAMQSGLHRLTDPAEMGDLFKVFQILVL